MKPVKEIPTSKIESIGYLARMVETYAVKLGVVRTVTSDTTMSDVYEILFKEAVEKLNESLVGLNENVLDRIKERNMK